MQLPQQFHAGHFRHAKIGNDHGGIETPHLLQGFGAITRRLGFIAPGAQQVRQTLPRVGVVFHYQNFSQFGHELTLRSIDILHCFGISRRDRPHELQASKCSADPFCGSTAFLC